MGALLPNKFKEILIMANFLKTLTEQQKVKAFDVIVDTLEKEGSYSILSMGYTLNKVIDELIKLKEEGKL